MGGKHATTLEWVAWALIAAVFVYIPVDMYRSGIKRIKREMKKGRELLHTIHATNPEGRVVIESPSFTKEDFLSKIPDGNIDIPVTLLTGETKHTTIPLKAFFIEGMISIDEKKIQQYILSHTTTQNIY